MMLFKNHKRIFLILAGIFVIVVFALKMDLFGKKPEILWSVKGVDLEMKESGGASIALQDDTIYAWDYYSPKITAIDKRSGRIENKLDIGLGTTGPGVVDG